MVPPQADAGATPRTGPIETLRGLPIAQRSQVQILPRYQGVWSLSLSWSLSSVLTNSTVRRRTRTPPELPHERSRPPLNGHADSWKACWWQRLASSNLASSAASSRENARASRVMRLALLASSLNFSPESPARSGIDQGIHSLQLNHASYYTSRRPRYDSGHPDRRHRPGQLQVADRHSWRVPVPASPGASWSSIAKSSSMRLDTTERR